jgi:hypothetical protein
MKWWAMKGFEPPDLALIKRVLYTELIAHNDLSNSLDPSIEVVGNERN